MRGLAQLEPAMISPHAVPVDLLLAYSSYLLGTASPGPSNLAIMSAAMHAGPRPALMLALGVVCGSLFWGCLAALGLSAVLADSAMALLAIKMAGGLYLFWLAYRSGRTAIAGLRVPAGMPGGEAGRKMFLRGAAMHLTNPKAIFVWLSIVALAMPAGGSLRDGLWMVAGCGAIGLLVFGGYAAVFSLPRVREGFLRVSRLFDGALSVSFTYAGWRMLASALKPAQA